jgi:hypothetical protein
MTSLYLWIPYWIGVGTVLFVTFFVVLEASLAHHWYQHCKKTDRCFDQLFPHHRIVVIVSAYLPNEITVLKDTLANLLKCEIPPNVEVPVPIIVAHNGGNEEQRETLQQIIRDLSDVNPSHYTMREINHSKSKSKADNINGTMAILAHLPIRSSDLRLWRSLTLIISPSSLASRRRSSD